MITSKITGERIGQYLSQGKRFDGRDLDEFREISIEYGISNKAEGSARVKMGKTDVVAGVKMDVSEPYPDSQDKGNLMVTAELLPMSSERFELGPPKIDAIELARVIDRLIRESKFIDLEKLCIKEGEKVWTVMIDIYSINADGNLLDACALAAIAALKAAKVPKYDEKEEKILYDEHEKSIPLKKELPLSITFYKIGSNFIVDPNVEEEDISEARITIGSHKNIISSMQKGKEKEFEEDEMYKVIDMVEPTWKKLFLKVEKLLK